MIITDQIPLTAIGKIFKPALKWDATRRIYEEELKTLGDLVTVEQVTVGEHKIHGTSVNITLKASSDKDPEDIRRRVSEVLARYTVHYELVVQ